MIADFWTFAADHLISFSGGVLVGFGLTSRYRVIRRNGEGDG